MNSKSVRYQSGIARPLWLLISVVMMIMGLTVWIPQYGDGYRPFMAWETTTGVIKSINIVECGRSSKGRVTVAPEILYEYSVAGTSYIGNRYFPNVWCASRNEVASKIESLSRNSTTPVFYSPKKPSFAVLNNDPSSFGTWFLILGIFIPLLVFKFSRDE